ncbi:MFS transporter [Streptomyces sp. M19]
MRGNHHDNENHRPSRPTSRGRPRRRPGWTASRGDHVPPQMGRAARVPLQLRPDRPEHLRLRRPRLREQWDLSLDGVGVITSVGFAGMFIGALLGGRLSDRFGRRRVLLGAVVFYSVFSLLSAASFTPWQMGVTRFLTGVGLQAMTGVLLVWVSEMYPRALRGRYQSWILVLGFVGVPVSAWVSRLVIPLGTESWRWVFVVGALGVVGVAVAARILPSPSAGRPRTAARTRPSPSSPGWRRRRSSAPARRCPSPPRRPAAPRPPRRPAHRPQPAAADRHVARVGLPDPVLLRLQLLGADPAGGERLHPVREPHRHLGARGCGRPRRAARGALHRPLGPALDAAGHRDLRGRAAAGVRPDRQRHRADRQRLPRHDAAPVRRGRAVHLHPRGLPDPLRGLGAGVATGFGRLSGVIGGVTVGWIYSTFGFAAVFVYLAAMALLMGLVLVVLGERTTNMALDAIGADPARTEADTDPEADPAADGTHTPKRSTP